MMGLDVDGNDNSPEWGWCTMEGCKEEAFPIWKSGDFPDDPDLLLCPKHIGETIGRLESDAAALRAVVLAYVVSATSADRNKMRADMYLMATTSGTGAQLLSDMEELRTANAGLALLNASYLAALDTAYRALLSYAHGNAAPALAEEVAEMVLQAIEKASGK